MSIGRQLVINKLSKEYKASVELNSHQSKVIYGLMLGDLHASRGKSTHNTRLQFNQGTVHTEYAQHLYDLFLPFINQLIYTTVRQPDPRTGLIYTSLLFKTLAFPFFNIYRDLYYFPAYGSGIRVLPLNLADYFTVISFAYWIMDDGTYAQGVLKFCTDSFTLDQVQFLCDMLGSKYDINCHPQHRAKGQYCIYIANREIDKVRALVRPYIIPSMLYKIGL